MPAGMAKHARQVCSYLSMHLGLDRSTSRLEQPSLSLVSKCHLWQAFCTAGMQTSLTLIHTCGACHCAICHITTLLIVAKLCVMANEVCADDVPEHDSTPRALMVWEGMH